MNSLFLLMVCWPGGNMIFLFNWFLSPLLNLRNSNLFFYQNLILSWTCTSNFDIWYKVQMKLEEVDILN